MGIAAHYNDTVTLVNRTIGGGVHERELNARYDGEDLVLVPGENPGIPRVVVPYALKQNPLMGSANPVNAGEYQCLVGVKPDVKRGIKGTNCDPIPAEILAAADAKMEIWDRNGDIWGETMRKVQPLRTKKTYNASDARAHGGAGFTGGPANANVE